MYDWAENECRIACKKENPEYDFDSDEFDYGCSCYKSALRAYKSLCEDGHSGVSFGFTKNILISLLNEEPLTPITDEDFFIPNNLPAESPEYLKEMGLKSSIQCPRRYSLFREETLDGKITYHDTDRYYYVDMEHPSDTYHSSAQFIDKMFPITMPYIPEKGKYEIYAKTFLTDKKNGDFDTRYISHVVTPSGKIVNIDQYQTSVDKGWKTISQEEYEIIASKRIDKLNEKIAEHLIWTLISNSANDEEILVREKAYDEIDQKQKDGWFIGLAKICEFFNNEKNYQYNTFSMHQALCQFIKEEYEKIPELVKIADYLKDILDAIKKTNIKND